LTLSLSGIEREISRRSQTDELIAAWPALLLSVVTCGIWGIVTFSRLLVRRDEHFRREAALFSEVVAVLRQKLETKGVGPVEEEKLRLIEARIKEKEAKEKRPLGLWLTLTFLFGFPGLYILTRDFFEHEQSQIAITNQINSLTDDLGGSAGSQFTPGVRQRGFWLYLGLTVITCLLFSVFWFYVLIEDPNRHFRHQVQWEDGLLESLQTL